MKVSLNVVLLCWMSVATSLSAADYVWIEGERPTTTPTLKQVEGVENVSPSNGFDFTGWGRTWIISDEQMLHVNRRGGDVDKYMPEEGLVFGYDFTLDARRQTEHLGANRLRMGAQRFSMADRRRAVADEFPAVADDQRSAAADVE